LPHDWSIFNSFNQRSPAGDGGGYLDGGIGWYRKTFTVPSDYSGKKVFIQFDGAYMNSQVWINGTYLGIRPYGYSSFEYDLTPYLNIGGKKRNCQSKSTTTSPTVAGIREAAFTATCG